MATVSASRRNDRPSCTRINVSTFAKAHIDSVASETGAKVSAHLQEKEQWMFSELADLTCCHSQLCRMSSGMKPVDIRRSRSPHHNFGHVCVDLRLTLVRKSPKRRSVLCAKATVSMLPTALSTPWTTTSLEKDWRR